MKLTIKLITRGKDGKETVLTVTGTSSSDTLESMRLLWEAERAINENSPIRCHIEL